MGIIGLNTVGLDGGVIIKKGGGGGGVRINNQDKVVDITENGTTEVVADGGYTGLGKVTINTEVSGGGAKPKWTGHADAEGLRAIGWTDEDIAYYQANGVNWNEEDDHLHLVSDDNKALYGVLTASNISTYKDRIVYLPKIDTSNVKNMSGTFMDCYSLTSIPMLDTSNATTMNSTFKNCFSLTSIPMLDTGNVTGMNSMFSGCYSLTSIPMLNTSNVTDTGFMFYNCNSLSSIPMLDTGKATTMSTMFQNCYSLSSIPMLDTSKATNTRSMFLNCYSLSSIPMLDTSKVWYVGDMFLNCYSLSSIPMLDTSKATDMNDVFDNCYSLTHANLKNVKSACDLSKATLLTKDSLLYLINNEAATSAITITLASYAYDKWANDPDIVAALANHPNISLAK